MIKNTTTLKVGFDAEHKELPNKTFEEIQAEVDAFNKAQMELIENEE